MCSVGWEEQERGAWRLWDGGSGLVIAKYVTAFHEPARALQLHADATESRASSCVATRPDPRWRRYCIHSSLFLLHWQLESSAIARAL